MYELREYFDPYAQIILYRIRIKIFINTVTEEADIMTFFDFCRRIQIVPGLQRILCIK